MIAEEGNFNQSETPQVVGELNLSSPVPLLDLGFRIQVDRFAETWPLHLVAAAELVPTLAAAHTL